MNELYYIIALAWLYISGLAVTYELGKTQEADWNIMDVCLVIFWPITGIFLMLINTWDKVTKR